MKDNLIITSAGLLVFGLLGTACLGLASALHTETVEVDVVSKERLLKVNSEGNSKYENFVTTEFDIYTVKDSWLKWEWYSLQTYAKVEPGKKCKLTLQGYRIGFFSMKQNIIEADCSPG